MASFVIMNVGNERLYRKHGVERIYKTQAAAQAQCTRLNKQYGGTLQWQAMSHEQFQYYHNPMVQTRNLMSGLPVMIRRSEQGTCIDPGTEQYWSM